MTPSNLKKNNWTICPQCRGQARILRGPSRKKRRQYNLDLEIFEKTNHKGPPPALPRKNLDICPGCDGAGLLASDGTQNLNTQHYPHVAIIGGGIGGTALAVACLHRGIPFALYERDDSFDARSQGYGLTLQQASKAIRGLGIFSLEGGIISTRHVVHDSSGKVIGEWGLRKWKQVDSEETSKRKNIHIARQSLRLALLEELGDSESVHWGRKLESFSKNNSGGWDIDFWVDGKKETQTADLIVGADGIRSTVREILIGENQTPLRYLGCIVVLGICRLDALADTDSPLLDSATVFQSVNGRERIYVMPYDAEHVMWQVSFPLGEQEAKELSKKGAQTMKEEVMRRLDWHDPIPGVLAATPSSLITGYPVYDRALLNPALLKDAGNITLIGDAAHPMSPFKGQGANQALLDALSLARSISIECGPGSGWRDIGLRKSVLARFEKEMVQRTNPKVLGSARAAELLHSDAVLHEGDEPRGRGF